MSRVFERFFVVFALVSLLSTNVFAVQNGKNLMM